MAGGSAGRLAPPWEGRNLLLPNRRSHAGGDGTPPLPATAQQHGPPVRNGPFYGMGWNADFLMPRIAAGSSFVKAKHLEPRSFSDAPMR